MEVIAFAAMCLLEGGGEWEVVRFTSYSCMWILMETTKISKPTRIKSHKVRYELSSAKWAGTFRVTLH